MEPKEKEDSWQIEGDDDKAPPMIVSRTKQAFK